MSHQIENWTEGSLLDLWCTWQSRCALEMQECCTVLWKGEPLYLEAKTFQCASIHMHISMPSLSKGLSFEIKINMSLKWIGDSFATFEIFLHFISEIFFNP